MGPKGIPLGAISRYNVSILLYISMGGTRRLYLKVFPSVPRRALRYALLAMTKKETFSINTLLQSWSKHILLTVTAYYDS